MSLPLESSPSSPAKPPRSRVAFWSRVGLAVALVAASGIARAQKSARIEAAKLSGWVSPFPLEDIPLELGPWEGHAEALDPTIARGAGAVDNIFRVYTDRRTGTQINVIALYGPAQAVSIHAPELCYPVSGYRQVGPTRQRSVLGLDDKKVDVRSLTYVKGEGGGAERQQVYYSWFYDGRWTPYMAAPKRIERIPAMYKVHLARSVGEHERLDGDDPCQDLLARLIPEIERRMAEAKPKVKNAG